MEGVQNTFFILAFAAPLLATSLFSSIHGQVNGNLAGAVSQLLDHPAPPPSPPKDLAEVLAAIKEADIKTIDGVPPEPGEDAPMKVLIDYWWKYGKDRRKLPSEKVHQRFLQACEEGPEFPFGMLDILPNTPDAHARIKRILDAGRNSQEFRQGLRDWLMCNSEYLRDELISDVRRAIDHSIGLSFADKLTALARSDWKTAEPLLKQHAKAAAPETAAFALSLLYEHAAQKSQLAEADFYRDRLKRAASYHNETDDLGPRDAARGVAVRALMETDWQGRDEWFLSLFADRTLSGEETGGFKIFVLAAPIIRDPDRWIPVLSQLLGDTDRNAHNAAALCLEMLGDPGILGRKDALLPLLPWLSDPHWADDPRENEVRASLAKSMGILNVREAIPGLILMIRNEVGHPYVRSQAIEALEKMRDSSVVPVLREMIQAEKKDQITSSPLIKSLIACGGLTIDETVAALDSCAAKATISAEKSGYIYIEAPNPGLFSASELFDIGVAQIVARQDYDASEALAAAVVERLKSVRREKPDVASKLWLIARRWRFPAVDVAIVERIADGSADLDTLLVACERRQELRDNAGGALRDLVAGGGYQAGAGAALLGDQSSELDILKGIDRAAQVAILAFARRLREPLPIENVGAMLKSPDKLSADAAERYLESEGSAEASKLIFATHPGEALILGAKDRPEVRTDEGKWVRWENSLREDVKKNQTDEIFAALDFDYYNYPVSSHSAIVRVRQGKAELCKRKDAMREECRQLTERELQSLRDLYKEISFDDLGPVALTPITTTSIGGSEGELIKLDKSGGRRVYVSNLNKLRELLPSKTNMPHVRLEAFFKRLCAEGHFELR